jgi:hypothetical protein
VAWKDFDFLINDLDCFWNFWAQFDFFAVNSDLLTTHVNPTDTPRSRQQRRERQRSFLKEQEMERARQRVSDRYHDNDRASVASTSSTGSCDSNSHTVEVESKYSSLSSLSDVETNDHSRGKSTEKIDTLDL